MLKDLMTLFNEDTIERFTKLFEDSYSKLTDCDKELFANATSFTDVDDHYELTLKVKENANNDNIKIDLNGRMVKIVYTEKTLKSESVVTIKEELPFDAVSETLDAYVVDGKLIVTVEKKKEKKLTTSRNENFGGPHFYA